ncbi:MAG: prolipoprotein diacylglyceryl transferase [Erysipelotrichaceae bacterium]|nr:prolipoprotein diacylglyceryl transferase [Erysipelotrichaceae bacterium]
MNEFYVFLIIGMFAMMAVMCLSGKVYSIPMHKSIIAACFLTVAGYIGIKIMYFVETGAWTGRSMYGAIFLVPVFMFPVSKLLKVEYRKLLDICAPAGCFMLALMKVKCMIDGCCSGKTFYFASGSFQFPSQIVEGVTSLAIGLILLKLIKDHTQCGLIYAWYLLLYGASRLVLNCFRWTHPWLGPLPAGHVWSLLAIAAGVVLLRSGRTTVHP